MTCTHTGIQVKICYFNTQGNEQNCLQDIFLLPVARSREQHFSNNHNNNSNNNDNNNNSTGSKTQPKRQMALKHKSEA